MSPGGGVGDGSLMSSDGLDFPDAETVPLQPFPGLGRAQVHVQIVGRGFGHFSQLPAGFYPICSNADRIETKGGFDVETATPNAEKTSDEIRQASEEDGEAEGAGEEADRQEAVMQHPGWILMVLGRTISGVGVVPDFVTDEWGIELE